MCACRNTPGCLVPEHLLLSVSEGHIVRNLLENCLLDRLLERSFEVTLLTPAYAIPAFRERWEQPGVRLEKLLPFESSKAQRRLAHVRRRLAKRGSRALARRLLARERRMASNGSKAYKEVLDANPWSLMLATHIHLHVEVPLVNAAYVRGIPTLGIVNSWDNVYKGIRAHPDHAVVWNEINKREMIEFEGYEARKVSAIGTPAFDPYFRPDTLWPREDFCRHFGFDPARPIILHATAGQYVKYFEETYLLEVLLRGIRENHFAPRPQILCRLHPHTKRDFFEPYRAHPDVRFSRYEHHVPTLGWCPTREEVVLAANILHHSAVCVSPGSTMALEAAIFDTPTLVPVFNDYQPEVWDDYYARYCLAWHFGRLVQEQMLPVARSYKEMIDWVNRYLADASLYKQGRRRIVEEYVQFTDGRAVERLADMARQIADGEAPGV